MNIGVARPDREVEFHTAGTDLLLPTISRRRMEEATRALWGRSIAETGDISTLVFRDPGTSATPGASWFARMEALIDPSEEFTAFESAAREIEERLLEDLLVAVAPPERPAPGAKCRRVARRAEVFIQEHWRESISLADLCRAAGGPDRALRRGFGRSTDVRRWLTSDGSECMQHGRSSFEPNASGRSATWLSSVASPTSDASPSNIAAPSARRPRRPATADAGYAPVVEFRLEVAFDHFGWR